MTYNIINVLKDTLTNTVQYAPDDIKNQRLALCLSCPNKKGLSNVALCTLCGCFIHSKVKYSLSECPDTPPRWKSHFNFQKNTGVVESTLQRK